MGPVPIEENESVFHSEWEAKVFAMSFATFINYFPVDETHHASEQIPPSDYLSSSYYERWIYALELLLSKHNLLTSDEIEARMAELAQLQS
ncbi:MAG: hypothetical protein AAGD25_41265 [Cyanobacteria bacterium P01_F01_bin.150]